MPKFIKYIPTILLIILTFLIFNEPGPIWLFPFFLILYHLKDPIQKFLRLNIQKYLMVGILIGLFIELLAIIDNLNVPPEQRALFHPDPIPDLILGFGYYLFLMLGSYLVLKKYDYSLKQFFIITGIYGIISEQNGAILLQVLGGNILAGIYVFLSYGPLFAIPYLFFINDFKQLQRKKSKFLKYPITLLILELSYGLFLIYYLSVNPIVSS